MEEMKNEELLEVEASEEKTWNDIRELADSEVTLPEEKSGGGIGLLLGGLATLAVGGGVAWFLKRRAKKRKENSPSESEVIDGEAKEMEEESDEDAETCEPSDSDYDDEESK